MKPRAHSLNRAALAIALTALLVLVSTLIPAIAYGNTKTWTDGQDGLPARLPAHLRDEWSVVPYSAMRSVVGHGAWMYDMKAIHRENPEYHLYVFEMQYGWPVATASKLTFGLQGFSGDEVWTWLDRLEHEAGLRRGIAIPIGSGRTMRLAVWPRRPQLAIVTAMYGGLVWCCLYAPGRIRRTRRQRRGLCPACGYDIQDQPTCPECGRTGTGWFRS